MIRRISISSFEWFNLASVKFASEPASQGNGPGGGWLETEAVLCAYCRAQGWNGTKNQRPAAAVVHPVATIFATQFGSTGQDGMARAGFRAFIFADQIKDLGISRH
jgi:hypothetical protein